MKNEAPKKHRFTRREFARLGGAALTSAAIPWIARPGRAAEPLVTEVPENEPLLQSIQFVSESVKEGQRCANCILFQPGTDGAGRCTILQRGLVPEGAWCLSWAAKP